MFPEQQYSSRAKLLKPTLMGWGFFPCRFEDVPLLVGARREVACRLMEWGGGGEEI